MLGQISLRGLCVEKKKNWIFGSTLTKDVVVGISVGFLGQIRRVSNEAKINFPSVGTPSESGFLYCESEDMVLH